MSQKRIVLKMKANLFFDRVIEEFEYYCFFIASVFLACMTILMIVGLSHQFSISLMDSRCEYFSVTGYDCLGCGGTRSLNLLLNGKFIESFRYNSIVPSVFVATAVYVFSSICSQLDYEKMFQTKCILIICVNVITILSNRYKNSERIANSGNPFIYLMVIVLVIAITGCVFTYLGNADVSDLSVISIGVIGLIGSSLVMNGSPFIFCSTFFTISCLPIMAAYYLVRRFMSRCLCLERQQI